MFFKTGVSNKSAGTVDIAWAVNLKYWGSEKKIDVEGRLVKTI